jgi:UDP-glucuronate 4-epimerase
VRALRPVGFEVVNLGNSHPHDLSQVISIIEENLGKRARIKQLAFQKTDMKATWADTGKAKRLLDWTPVIPLSEGLKRTVEWYVKNRPWAKELVIDMTK